MNVLARLAATLRASGDQVAVAFLVVEAGAALMGSFCPSWFDIRTSGQTRPGYVAAVRQGYTAAGLLTMVTGAASAYIVRSPLPLFGAALITSAEIGAYEYCIGHPAPQEPAAPPPPYMSALQWGAAK